MKNIVRFADAFCTGAALTAAILISLCHLKDVTIGNGFYVWTLINSVIAWFCFIHRTANKN